MKAVRYSEYGDASVLRYQDVETPTPGAGQVLVKVAATSFNPVDVAIRAGFLQQAFALTFPHTPGSDVAGTVASLGAGVSGFAIGDGVIGFLPMNEDGSAAEYALASAGLLTVAPTSIPLADAAALPAVGLTAWQALFEHANLQPGQRILINGAGGAVGGYAVQFAVAAGAVVLATASPRSASRVRSYGAAEVIDYTAGSVVEAVTEPVDVVLNLVIGPESAMAGLVGLVRAGGIFVTTTSDAPAGVTVRAVHVYVRSDAAQLAALVAKVDAGELRVDVGERYPLDQLASVHELSVAGKLAGKVILVP
jgi:NADPH:quinone reductase-like Zn-dependent oxidoreductase